MPVYNGEAYIAEAVESILEQTFTDFEFIIINDGSTDESSAILREYAERDSRIQLITRANRGISSSRNEALQLAAGEFVAMADADDVSQPNRLECEVEWLRKEPKCVAVGSAMLLIDPEGEPICVWRVPLVHEDIDTALLRRGRGGAIGQPSVMMRRAAIEEVGGYCEELATAEDMDLFLRLAEHARLANIPDPLVKYRQHLRSVCHDWGEQTTRDTQKVLDDTWKRRGLTGLPVRAVTVRPSSEVNVHCKWAWWALNAKNVRTARKHAIRSLRLAPFSLASWRVLACAIRGH